ncbi:MAG: glycosyltransferase [Chitinophagaceae bacterium]|nr:glycosyltransferase [Chitinophagaceae bacterium]
MYNFLVKRLYKNMDKIVCQSKEMYIDLAEKYNIKREKLHVIYNPVAIPEQLNQVRIFDAGNKIKLLCIGRLSPEKGNMRLLHIISLLTIPYQLIILGDGPEKKDLEEEAQKLNIQDHIIFKGAVANANDYITECDCVLFSTYNEGLPNIVLETGILGKPVIAFKVPGVDEEVIENGVTGFLINGDNHQDFCNAIEKLQTTKFDDKKIRQKVLEKYAVQKIINDYDNLFNQISRVKYHTIAS